MDYTIRPAKKSDYKKCAEILLDEFNKQGEGFTQKTALKRISYSPSPRIFFCAKSNKELIGFIFASKGFYASGPYYWINELVVRQDFQNKGIGTALVEKLSFEAKKKGVKNIYLNSTNKNLKFYENIGFKKTGYLGMAKEE